MLSTVGLQNERRPEVHKARERQRHKDLCRHKNYLTQLPFQTDAAVAETTIHITWARDVALTWRAI